MPDDDLIATARRMMIANRKARKAIKTHRTLLAHQTAAITHTAPHPGKFPTRYKTG